MTTEIITQMKPKQKLQNIKRYDNIMKIKMNMTIQIKIKVEWKQK